MTQDDLDAPEDLDQEGDDFAAGKPSLKEVWESSPILKIGAVALGIAVLLGGYMIIFSNSDERTKATIRIAGADKAKAVPGQHELDARYKEAIEAANKRAAEEAAKKGTSALPTPINTIKNSGVNIPDMPGRPRDDVLSEWRKATESGRLKQAGDDIEEEGGGPRQGMDVVPMAQPVRPQAAPLKPDPNAAKLLAAQMRVIIAAQAPLKPDDMVITKEDSPYKIMKDEEAKQKQQLEAAQNAAAASGAQDLAAQGAPPIKTIVPAGAIAYVQLLNELNSDIQGPVLAQVLSGPFAGGRMIGKISVKDEYMVINFKHAVKDTVSYKMDGIALDENTTLAGQATDVDHHYLTRVILPAAAKFVEGYGSALAQTGTTVSQTDGGAQAVDQPAPGAKEAAYKGLEESTKEISKMLDKGSERPITVKIAKGTTMGVLFVDTVTTKDTE